MNLIDRATVIHFHRHRIAEFGADSVRALGWVSEASQTSRFEVVAQAADFNDSSVLDLGCGTGDLKAFLELKLSPRVSLVRGALPEAVTIVMDTVA
jgi:SAM-dependent methyltransferase